MKIYTKKGDQGQTSLYGGKRLSKGDLRIESYGTVDELNSNIGLIITYINNKKPSQKKLAEQLISIQSRLFDLGTHLAAEPGKKNLILPELNASHIAILETQIDAWQNKLPELKFFILPGGDLAAAQAHIARTVCRRAERFVVRLAESEKVQPVLIQYLNRLSDYLFVLARFLNHRAKTTEIVWKSH
jgi:cob(I)alamin adenosyltransferase